MKALVFFGVLAIFVLLFVLRTRRRSDRRTTGRDGSTSGDGGSSCNADATDGGCGGDGGGD